MQNCRFCLTNGHLLSWSESEIGSRSIWFINLDPGKNNEVHYKFIKFNCCGTRQYWVQSVNLMWLGEYKPDKEMDISQFGWWNWCAPTWRGEIKNKSWLCPRGQTISRQWDEGVRGHNYDNQWIITEWKVIQCQTEQCKSRNLGIGIRWEY